MSKKNHIGISQRHENVVNSGRRNGDNKVKEMFVKTN